ncbi:MAG TPA: prepilin peptidase [Chloroflexi bacterium]|nr:prepilin peptidase [Chloroflexota bacterium]
MLGYVVAALVGGLLGMVVNVLADRLPRFRMTPRSAETPAEAPEPEGESTPSAGGGHHPARVVGVVLFMALATAYLWGREGLTPLTGILIFYVALFLLIAVIDIEHRLVLNVVMLPAFVIALIEVALSGRIALRDGLVGYAIGQIVVMGIYLLGGVYLWIVNTARHEPVREIPFGFGDVTLATFCGLVVGSPGIVVVLVLMILLGGLIALLYIGYRLVVARQYKAHTPVPYGPSIVLAATIMLLWGEQVTAWITGG